MAEEPSVSFTPDIKVVKLLKALDNTIRLKIVEYVINSSPVSFTQIIEYLDEKTGRELNKGTLSYHLDILVQSGVLSKELRRHDEGREYSFYDITDYGKEKLKALKLLIPEN